MSAGEGWADLQVRVDPRWIELPVRQQQDAGTWAEEAVEAALSLRSAQHERPEVRMLYVQAYAAIVEQLRSRPDHGLPVPAAAFALVAVDDLLPVTVVELNSHPLAGRASTPLSTL